MENKEYIKGNVKLREVKAMLREYGSISNISFKGWEQIRVVSNGIRLRIDYKDFSVIYSNIHGTFGNGILLT